MLKYLVKPLHGVPFTPWGMPTLFQNDHTEILHRGCKWLLYPFCRVWITITVKSYHRAGDRCNTPEQFSCCSQLGSCRPDALVHLSRISNSTKTRGIVRYLNGIIGISLVRQLTET